MWKELTEKVTGLSGRWASLAALGSFLIYLVGYLALRFQLSAYGVATNLDVWDERYLFAGSRFLVYLISSVPNVLLIVIVLVAAGYLPYRVLPSGVRERMRHRVAAWAMRPASVALLGVLLALGLIQFALRKCFVLSNLLLRQDLPRREWISALLLSGDANRSFYFSALLGGALLTGLLLVLASRTGVPSTPFSAFLVGLLAFLVAVEFLLLPANYGILIATPDLPRVSEIAGEEKLAAGDQAWLVWDSKDAIVYLVRGPDGKRTLVTVPRKDPKVKIVGYDQIFCVLFGTSRECS